MCQHFSEGHFSIKMGSKGPKLLDFSKFIIKLSEIKKMFFYSVLGLSRRCRHIVPPWTQKPRTIRVKYLNTYAWQNQRYVKKRHNIKLFGLLDCSLLIVSLKPIIEGVAHTFPKWLNISPLKKGWSHISWLFIIHNKFSENSKKVWDFIVILGYFEGAVNIQNDLTYRVKPIHI